MMKELRRFGGTPAKMSYVFFFWFLVNRVDERSKSETLGTRNTRRHKQIEFLL